MEAFKKWTRECPSTLTDCNDLKCSSCREIQRAAWRAALTWTLKTEKKTRRTGRSYWYV